jgi:hypothetical protein
MLRTKHYEKGDDFNFLIVNLSFFLSDIILSVLGITASDQPLVASYVRFCHV